MFTWICPKCGREVGPSYSECPFCADAAAAKPQPPPPVVAPPQPSYTPPAPPQAQYTPPQPLTPRVESQPPPLPLPPPPPQQVYYVGEDDNKRSIPGWLAALLAFVVVALIAYGVVYFARSNRLPAAASKAEVAEKLKAAGNPYSKFLELTGFRITEATGKKLQVQFLAVNHGAADLSGIEGTITMQVKGEPDAEPACTFKFQIENIPAFGAKEIEVKAFIQKRKFFDMPDWLFLNPVVEFTSTE